MIETAMELVGRSGQSLTPEVGLALTREYQTWSGHPTKKNTPAARRAGICRALARLADPSLYGSTVEEAAEQLRRSLL